MNGPRTGLLTMHRVLNCGSALQAYALQRKIEENGCQCEIIDYIYPQPEPYFKWNIASCRKLLVQAALGFPDLVMRKRFDRFYEKELHLTARQWRSREELEQNPPRYDLLATGSDQVWNPRFMKNDTSFLLSFCKDSTPRIAYAPSFAVNSIPEHLHELYRDFLRKYRALSVREQSGTDIIRNLTGQTAPAVCDPTLLLTKEEWSRLAEKSQRAVRQPYILVYLLRYSYNPYPQVYNIIRQVQEALKLPAVHLNGRLPDYFRGKTTVVKDAGPYEFIRLFADASFVITNSFHGTSFALNFEKPFYSVLKDTAGKTDSRIFSLLHLAGAEERAVSYDAEKLEEPAMEYSSVTEKLNLFRKDSLDFLKNAAAEAFPPAAGARL